MTRWCGLVPVLAASVGLGLASPARGATCTVGTEACPTLARALAAAQQDPGPDVVRLPAGETASDGASYRDDDRLELTGQGAGSSRVTGRLEVVGARVVVRGFELRAPGGRGAVLEASGQVRAIRLTGDTTGGVAIRAAVGRTPLELDDVLVTATGLDAALDAPCADLRARHVTLAGSGGAGARASCTSAGGAATLSLDSSVVAGGYPVALLEGAGGDVRASYSNLAGQAQGTVTDRVPGDPRFVAGDDPRPGPESPLLEAGNPAPLLVDRPASGEPDRSEPMEDLDGGVRVADADGDGMARRDVGAYEREATPKALPSGNLLADPDAEGSVSAAPRGWDLEGGFTTEAYGTAPFPSTRAGAAVGGGKRFFAGGSSASASATQRVDVSGEAAAIDRGAARATLSGLLGGYRADGDEAGMRATFHGPSGVVVGRLDLRPPAAAERGHATNLLARSTTGEVPALTRTIQVTLLARRRTGTYDDAYFDNLALRLDVPGKNGADRSMRPRPFAGILVLSGRGPVSPRAAVTRLHVGCASDSVAHCTGELTLEARLGRSASRGVIARRRVSLAAGVARTVRVSLRPPARRYLRRHRRLEVRLGVASVDGQGVRRVTTAPVVLRRSRSVRRAASRRAASQQGRDPARRGTASARRAPPGAAR